MLKSLKEMPFQWIFNPIIKIIAIGNVRNVGKCSRLGRFLDCQKFNILAGTRASPDIYARAIGCHVYISGKVPLPLLLPILKIFISSVLAIQKSHFLCKYKIWSKAAS